MKNLIVCLLVVGLFGCASERRFLGFVEVPEEENEEEYLNFKNVCDVIDCTVILKREDKKCRSYEMFTDSECVLTFTACNDNTFVVESTDECFEEQDPDEDSDQENEDDSDEDQENEDDSDEEENDHPRCTIALEKGKGKKIGLKKLCLGE